MEVPIEDEIPLAEMRPEPKLAAKKDSKVTVQKMLRKSSYMNLLMDALFGTLHAEEFADGAPSPSK